MMYWGDVSGAEQGGKWYYDGNKNQEQIGWIAKLVDVASLVNPKIC